MACTYTINDGSRKGEALNDEQFDALLYDVINKTGVDLEQYLSKYPELIFSLDKRTENLEKIDRIQKNVSSIIANSKSFGYDDSEPDVAEKLHDAEGFIGITSLITQYGNLKKGIDHPIVTAFDEIRWESNERTRLANLGVSSDRIDVIIKDTKETWKKLQLVGDDVHAIYEATFKETAIPETINLPADISAEVIKQAAEFRAELIRKYSFGDPAKVSFFPELSISSKDIDPDLKTILKEKGINNISGTIDLLVIDAHGNAHIYDYKTSRKKIDPDDWQITKNSLIGPDHWSSSKKLSVKNQLAAYKCLLEQWGIKNATCEMVPIYLDLEYTDEHKSTISRIKGITRFEEQVVPETSNGETYGNWKGILPVKINTSMEESSKLANKYQQLFPTEHITSLQVQQFEADVEFYRNTVKDVTSDDKEHYGKDKFYFVKHETNGIREYAKNKQDLEEKLEAYVQQVKEKKSNELHALANTLTHALSGQITLEEFVNDYRINDKNFLLTQFSRYINEGWDLVSDDNMIGMGLFLFQHDGRSEMMVISNKALYNVTNLGRGKSLLGRTLEDTYVDSKEILAANNGNMEAMKAMIYIADHPELFVQNKLTQLVVLNPWRSQRTYINNSQWTYNYNRLIKTVENQDDFNEINTDIFYDDIVSLLSIVDSNLKSAETAAELKGFSLDGQVLADGNIAQFTEEYVENAIKWMKAKYKFLVNAENEMLGDQNIWMAYDYLNQTLLALKGLRVYSELDSGEWMSSGIKAGLSVASPGYSPSTNFRVFDDVMQQYALDVRLAVEKQGRPIISSLMKFYKSKGQNKIVGGEANYFLDWFVKDTDGNITKEFRLKDPNDSDFDGQPEAREALDVWLKTMAELRWPKSDFKTEEDWQNTIDRMKATGEYYQVPLTEAAFSRQVKGVGLWTTVKNKFAQYKELTEDVFAGQTEEKEKWRREHHWELYNKFNKSASQRESLINEHGIGFFETNLEDVMNQALVAYNKTKFSRKYIPIIDAMRVSLRCAQSYGGANMKETLRSFDKLVKSKFYGESIVDAELQPYMRWVQVLKSGFSKLQLGFNFRSFFRELFQGTWMGMSRSGIELLPGVDVKTYTEGALHVVTNAHKNFSNVSLLQQLNSQYGMANYSMGQIARQRRMNWYGIKNFRSDTLFLTSSAPDFQHRMAILVAKMMGDGCWEAHSLDENGFIKYDFTKDARFSVYLSGDTKHKDYISQKSNYLARIAELNRLGITKEDGTKYEEGDALPMAYLPREVQSIKNFADLLYGHYDDESKSLMNDMLLGSMFLQYKTYVTSRVEQWTMTEGIYNTNMLVQDTDPVTGELLYKFHNGLDEYGMPNIEIKTREQIEKTHNFDEMVQQNKIEACMVWKGIPMEGMARSYFKFVKDASHWNWADFKQKWNNPIERDNVLIGLHDCLFMSLMMMLVTGLFGMMFDGKWETDRTKVARSMQNHGWIPSFTYNVAYGSFSDFPFWQTLGNMFSDLNPSVVTSGKKIVETTGNVLIGKKTVAQAITNTIGAAADLRGWANSLAKAANQ